MSTRDTDDDGATSNVYWCREEKDKDDWGRWLVVPVQKIFADIVATFDEFPPIQKPGSFTVSDISEHIYASANL